jgi:O-antigen/teichoic acid export membrane protein
LGQVIDGTVIHGSMTLDRDNLAHAPEDGRIVRGSSVVRGSAFTVLAHGVRLATQVAGLVLLARLLTPEDFGVFAMAAAVAGFVGVVNAVGFSMQTVQKPDLTMQDVSNGFWLGLGTSVGLLLISAALAPLAASVYGDARVAPLIAALAVALVFQALYAQQEALLARRMQFGTIAYVHVAGAIAGLAGSLALAGAYPGAWALVLLQVVPHAVTAGLVFAVVSWRPTRLQRDSAARSTLAFGGWVSGFNVLNYFGRNADNMLIGWRFGAEALGPYALAYRLLFLPMQLISFPVFKVAVPALSKLIGGLQAAVPQYC